MVAVRSGAEASGGDDGNGDSDEGRERRQRRGKGEATTVARYRGSPLAQMWCAVEIIQMLPSPPAESAN